MKTITCIDCTQEFIGSNIEELMNIMMPHYVDVHKDIMEQGTEEKKKIWMQELNNRWDQAPQM